jgi:NADPH2:quinone reductase
LFDGMKAVVISRPGPPDVLRIEERPKPFPKAEEVLISVRAAGLNRADLIQRGGRYPAPPDAPADIPGLEVAGVIEEVSSLSLSALLIASINSRMVPKSRLCGLRTIR